MMGDDTLTHKDLSGMLGVSQTTIKNYRRKFPGLIPLATRGKPLRFKPEAAEICKTIRDGFEHGLSVDEIREKLAPKYAAKPEPGGTGNDAGLVQALENLSAHMQDMAEGHKAVLDRLQAVEAGLQGLPAAMREILEPLAASTAGQGDEQAHTIDQAPEPEAREEANQDRGRTVRIRARDGSYKRYELKHLQGEAEDQAATEPEAGPGEQAAATEEDDETSSGDGPSTSFYRLPMVVRSEKGEFLGVPGRTEGHLSIDDFLALLRRQIQGEGRLPVTWSGGGDDWTISVCLGKPPFGQDHVMDLARMTTPRGNKVAWLKGMKVGGKKMPDSFLATFLKQLRRELSS